MKMWNRWKNRIPCVVAKCIASRNLLVVVAFCGIVLCALSGCRTSVGGRERSLLSHGPVHGEVELRADGYKNDQGSRQTESLVFEERIRLRTEGDFYHPNLLAYSAMIGAGLIQEEFESDESSNRTSGQTDEYSLAMDLLRGKSYPVRLYSDKSRTIQPRDFLGPLEIESSNSGASVRWRSESWPMQFEYGESRIIQDSLSSNSGLTGSDFSDYRSKRFGYNVSHNFSDNSRLQFQFQQNRTTSETRTSKLSTKQETYTLNHQQVFGRDNRYSLNSSLSIDNNEAQTTVKRTQWIERLRLRHSNNFSTSYEFRYDETEQALFKNRQTLWQGDFEHRLYESLTTSGSVFLEESDFGTGNTSQRRGYNLNFNYRKQNPWGMLSSTFGGSLTQTEQSGGTGGVGIVVDEEHYAATEPVELDRRSIDTTTILVHDGSGNYYAEGEDYLVTEVNGRIRLEMQAFGGNFPDFTLLDGTEKFYVDYNYLVEPESRIDVQSRYFRIMQAFNNGFGIYYNHRRTDEEVSSNTVAISPDESRSNVYGATYRKGPLRLRAEYAEDSSTFVRSNRKLLEGGYQWNLSRRTNLTFRGSKEFFTFEEPAQYETSIMRFGGNLSSQLTNRHNLSVRANYYTNESDRGDSTEGLALGALWNYKYRQLNVQAGVNFNSLENTRQSTENTRFFIRVIRRF